MGVVVFLLLQALFTGVVPTSFEDHALLAAGVGVGTLDLWFHIGVVGFGSMFRFDCLTAAGAPSSSSLDSPKGERRVFRGSFGDVFDGDLFQDMDEWL